MRVLLINVLICISLGSIAQNFIVEEVNGRLYEKRLFEDGFIIYRPVCENKEDYLFASRYVTTYDSLKHIGYLNSYDYYEHFTCEKLRDTVFTKGLKRLIATEENLTHKVSMLFGMSDKKGEFIACLFLFKKKNFEKFIKNAKKKKGRMFSSGEEIKINVYNYKKYSKAFIIAKHNNALELYRVRKR